MAHAFRYLIFLLLGTGAALAQNRATEQAVRFTVFAAKPIADLTFVARPNGFSFRIGEWY